MRRLGIVYGYRILDPGAGGHPTDYVGQTIQTLAARDRQHRGKAPNRDGSVKEQPWSDLIVGQPYVIEQGFWTAAELDEREQHYITTLRPRYNIAGNYGNPDRIKPWEAQAQRIARDLAAQAAQPWTPPEPPRRPAWPVRAWRWLAATPAARSVKRGLRRLAPWLAVAVAVWVALLFQHVPPGDAAPFAAIASGLLWGACRWLRNGWRDLTKPKARTRRANTRRRTRPHPTCSHEASKALTGQRTNRRRTR